MMTWQDQGCSTIPLVRLEGDPTIDYGVIQWFLGLGGSPVASADVTHAGWLPRELFDLITLEGDGGDFILGITFGFVFVEADQTFTDVDGNGKLDIMFREIYYNDNFNWSIDRDLDGEIDVETIALHEAGHALSQEDFGKIFRTGRNGKIRFAPRAVMNAAYSGVQQMLTGTDNGGHCSIWAAWPNQ